MLFAKLALDNDPYYSQLLSNRSNALFLTDKASIDSDVRVDCLQSGKRAEEGEDNVVRSTIISEAGLKNFLAELSSASHDTYMFIPQNHSWSPLQLSLGMYQALCEQVGIVPDFLDLLSGFGVKTSEIHEELPTSCQRSHYSENEAMKPQGCAIGYNFYHVEQHGRSNLTDPWSIRQTAVYHKFLFDDEKSTWILVQLAKPIRHIIEKVIAQKIPSHSTKHVQWLLPIEIHVAILTASQRKWKLYIQYLAERVANLHEIARFSEVSYRLTPDYTLDFTDCQTLELLQGKIRRCISIMEAHAETISSVSTYYQKLQKSHPTSTALPQAYIDDITTSINECHSLNARHTRGLKELLSSAESTKLLLYKILDHRNDAVLHANGFALQEIAQRSASQSEAMVSLTELAHHDSRIMRIVAFVAMVYLPVGLVSAFFSSNIVQLLSKDATDSGAELQREVGFFVIATLVLTGLTVAATFLWEWRERRAGVLRAGGAQMALQAGGKEKPKTV